MVIDCVLCDVSHHSDLIFVGWGNDVVEIVLLQEGKREGTQKEVIEKQLLHDGLQQGFVLKKGWGFNTGPKISCISLYSNLLKEFVFGHLLKYEGGTVCFRFAP